jgi:Na+/H+-translocating membrane pyrophosphatase
MLEYKYLLVFVAAIAVTIALTAEPQFGQYYTTCAFLIGALGSIGSSFLSMRIAVYSNVRAAKECAEDLTKGFLVTYRSGQVIGFSLVGIALLLLHSITQIY